MHPFVSIEVAFFHNECFKVGINFNVFADLSLNKKNYSDLSVCIPSAGDYIS